MATTDGRIQCSVALWPGTLSRRILEDDGSWCWRRAHPGSYSNIPPVLRVSMLYQSHGSTVRAMELAVMENGHCLESVELSYVLRRATTIVFSFLFSSNKEGFPCLTPSSPPSLSPQRCAWQGRRARGARA